MSSKVELHEPTMALLHMVHDNLRNDAIKPFDEFLAGIIQYKNLGPTYVLTYKGVPIGMAGVFQFRPGVAQCWFAMTDNVNQCKLAFCKRVIQLRDHYWTEWNLHRIQAEVEATYKSGNKWLKFMGMEYEGCMKRYGSNKNDYNLYAYTGA